MIAYPRIVSRIRYDTISRLAFLCLLLMSAFLNQGQTMFGFNISIADFFVFPVFLYFAGSGRLRVRIVYVSFFLLLSVFGFLSVVFIFPHITSLNPSFGIISSGYIKLVASFLYFLLGFSLSEQRWSYAVLKAYSLTAMAIGSFGVALLLSDAGLFRERMFAGSIRLQGLMSDPNYFSVIQVSALVFFLRYNKLSKMLRLLSSLLLTISIIGSGSKTGMVVLIIYLALLLTEKAFRSNRRTLLLIVLILLVLIFFLSYDSFASILAEFSNNLSRIIPSFRRVSILFSDFSEAITGEGSSRERVWSTGFGMMFISPIFGVGSAYSELSTIFFGVRIVSHNTFLQIFAEWGIPLAVCLFIFTAVLIVKASQDKRKGDYVVVIARDIVIVLLIGSMGVSLNNARMFWFFLGLLSMSLESCSKFEEEEKTRSFLATGNASPTNTFHKRQP